MRAKRRETLTAQGSGRVAEPYREIVEPIHVATTYERGTDGSYPGGRVYSRADNPTYDAPEALIASLEGAHAALLFASGEAAAGAFFQALMPGAVLAPRNMYWALRKWLLDFAKPRGLAVEFYDNASIDDLAAKARAVKPRGIWIETPANPTWEVTDIAAASAIAREVGAVIGIDSTVATPLLTRPIELGASIVMHSATKYLNGHSDVIAGALAAARDDALWQSIRYIRGGGGSVLGPFESWLLLRGIRTLHLRVACTCSNAMAIAQRFERHPKLSHVLYPGLASNRLQERIASLLGKAASLFLPSGTMANQVALRVLTQPGDDVIVSPESHAVWHETGGSAANAGVQFTTVGARGVFTAEEFAAAVKPRGHVIYPPTTLVEIENTHNRSGGVIFPQADAVKVCAAARERGIATYLDGARLWNVAAATGAKLADLAEPFDLVGVSLSKGLGAPGGSLLAGSKELVARCVRHRRMLGGAMRQSGILSAAGLYALDHNLERLRDDHANARAIATTLAASKRVILDLATVQTNIVVFHLTPEAPDGPAVVARAKERSVLVYAFGPRTVRLVTHLDVSAAQCATAAGILRSVVDG